MDVLCAMQPSVVKATRPNIYGQRTYHNEQCTLWKNCTEDPWTSFVTANRRSMVHYTVWYCAFFFGMLLLLLLLSCENFETSYILKFNSFFKQTLPNTQKIDLQRTGIWK